MKEIQIPIKNSTFSWLIVFGSLEEPYITIYSGVCNPIILDEAQLNALSFTSSGGLKEALNKVIVYLSGIRFSNNNMINEL